MSSKKVKQEKLPSADSEDSTKKEGKKRPKVPKVSPREAGASKSDGQLKKAKSVDSGSSVPAKKRPGSAQVARQRSVPEDDTLKRPTSARSVQKKMSGKATTPRATSRSTSETGLGVVGHKVTSARSNTPRKTGSGTQQVKSSSAIGAVSEFSGGKDVLEEKFVGVKDGKVTMVTKDNPKSSDVFTRSNISTVRQCYGLVEDAGLSGLGASTAWDIDLSGWVGGSATSKLKKKKSTPRPDSARSSRSNQSNPDELYVPPRNTATPEGMAKTKVMDPQRWFCISRPQYKTSCGMSSVVSCWNYLFSTLGKGSLPPITQEEALVILGFAPPFSEIKFGPFTGNKTLMRWFRQLNLHYGVRGSSHFLYKPKGRNQTYGVSSEDGLFQLKQGLQRDNIAYIYHCFNHYFCPIGFEDVPLKPNQAYRTDLKQDEVETWILIGDPSRMYPSIHCKRWSDIDTDLNCESPFHLNIRHVYRGVQERNTKKSGSNLHCIMAFTCSKFQGRKPTSFIKGPRTQKGMQDVCEGQDATSGEQGMESEIADTFVVDSEEDEYDFNQIKIGVDDDECDDEYDDEMVDDMSQDPFRNLPKDDRVPPWMLASVPGDEKVSTPHSLPPSTNTVTPALSNTSAPRGNLDNASVTGEISMLPVAQVTTGSDTKTLASSGSQPSADKQPRNLVEYVLPVKKCDVESDTFPKDTCVTNSSGDEMSNKVITAVPAAQSGIIETVVNCGKTESKVDSDVKHVTTVIPQSAHQSSNIDIRNKQQRLVEGTQSTRVDSQSSIGTETCAGDLSKDAVDSNYKATERGADIAATNEELAFAPCRSTSSDLDPLAVRVYKMKPVSTETGGDTVNPSGTFTKSSASVERQSEELKVITEQEVPVTMEMVKDESQTKLTDELRNLDGEGKSEALKTPNDEACSPVGPVSSDAKTLTLGDGLKDLVIDEATSGNSEKQIIRNGEPVLSKKISEKTVQDYGAVEECDPESLELTGVSTGMGKDTMFLDPLAMKVQRLDLGSLLSDSDKENLERSGLLGTENSEIKSSDFSVMNDFEDEEINDSENGFAAKVQRFNFGSLIKGTDVAPEIKVSTSDSLFLKSEKVLSALYGDNVIAAILKETSHCDSMHKTVPVASSQDEINDPRLTKSWSEEYLRSAGGTSSPPEVSGQDSDELVKRKIDSKTFIKKV